MRLGTKSNNDTRKRRDPDYNDYDFIFICNDHLQKYYTLTTLAAACSQKRRIETNFILLHYHPPKK